MCKLILDGGDFSNFTTISNIFIDTYMPQANGDYVKIYLYLIRHISSLSKRDFSLSKIADTFGLIESDVLRALKYWEKKELLSLSFAENGEISCICIKPMIGNHCVMKGVFSMNNGNEQDLTNKPVDNEPSESQEENNSTVLTHNDFVVTDIVPDEKKYSKEEFKKLTHNPNIKQLAFVAGTYLGKPLTQLEMTDILYMSYSLKFDTEFIEFIMEKCIQAGVKNIGKMKKEAKYYFMRGIKNKNDAKIDENIRNIIAKKVYEIFNLSSKEHAPSDLDFIRKWSVTYKFSDEFIFEACNRTMATLRKPSFSYADGILTKWYDNNAYTFEEVALLDSIHAKEFKKKMANNLPKPSKKTVVSKAKARKSNFTQRNYDYDDLEKQLRKSQDAKIKDIVKEK